VREVSSRSPAFGGGDFPHTKRLQGEASLKKDVIPGLAGILANFPLVDDNIHKKRKLFKTSNSVYFI